MNVVKHAGVGEARVALRTDRGQVILLVADEGDGGADRAGSGLRGLADRLEAVGGQLDVTSRARAGATIEARVPLPEGTR